MKITGVKTTLYQPAAADGPGNASRKGAASSDARCLVELDTDAGITGLAIGAAWAREDIERLSRMALTGEDPAAVVALWQRMIANDFERGQRDGVAAAAAVLDQALWDLKAKANEEPLWKALGSARPQANAHISRRGGMSADKALSDWIAHMVDEYGFRAVKLHVGRDAEADMDRLERVTEELSRGAGPASLMIDADECWSPKQAVRRVRALEQAFDLTWVEAPVPRWDFPGHKRVSDSVRAAVCAGGYLESPGDFLPHFRHHALDVVRIDPARVGITGALQIADAAYGYELPVTLAAGPGNMGAHLAGGMPYFMSLEVIDPAADSGVVATDVRIEGGRAVVGERPGNGLVADPERLAKAAVGTRRHGEAR